MGRSKESWKTKTLEVQKPSRKNNEKKFAKVLKNKSQRSYASRQLNHTPESLYSNEIDDFYAAKTQLSDDIDYIPLNGINDVDSDQEAGKAMHLDLEAAEEESEDALDDEFVDENDVTLPEKDVSSEDETHATLTEPEISRTHWGKKSSAYYEEAVDTDDESDEEIMNLRREEAEKMDREEEYEGLQEGDYKMKLLTSLRSSRKDSKSSKITAISSATSSPSTTAASVSPHEKQTSYEEELQAIVRAFEASPALPTEPPSMQASENLSSEALISLLQKNSAEFEPLIRDMQEKLKELNEELHPLLEKMNRFQGVLTEEGFSFLHTKNQLFMGYLTYLSYYLLLKCHGHSVKNHPVIQRLVEFRFLLEKIKPIEQKLRYQIDRLLDIAENAQSLPSLSLQPRPNALLSVEEDQKDEENAEESNKAVYKAPKLLPLEYTHHHLSEAEKAEKEKERQNLRLRRSEMVRLMRETLTEEPEEREGFDSYELLAKGKNEKYLATLHQKHLEREKFEEENLLRLPTTKKYKKEKMKLAQQPSRTVGGSTLDDLVGFAETVVDQDTEEALAPASQAASSTLSNASLYPPSSTTKKTTALTAYLNAVAQATQAQRRLKEMEARGDTWVQSRPLPKPRNSTRFETFETTHGAREDSREASLSFEENEDFAELKEIAANRKITKQQRLIQRSQKFIPSSEPSLKKGSKRAISTLIQKNRGLTRQRKPIEGTARAHYRLKYVKKMKKLKSQRPEMRFQEGKYRGELTGLASTTRKSQPLS